MMKMSLDVAGRPGGDAPPRESREVRADGEIVTPAAPLEEGNVASAAYGLLSPSADFAWSREVRRVGASLALSLLYGLALGARHGGAALVIAALGVAAGVGAVVVLALPALTIVLMLGDSPLDARALLRAGARGAATVGLVLAGLSPIAALFVLTGEGSLGGQVVGAAGLVLAGALGARAFVTGLWPALRDASRRARLVGALAIDGFLLFSAVLSGRVWWLLLGFGAAS